MQAFAIMALPNRYIFWVVILAALLQATAVAGFSRATALAAAGDNAQGNIHVEVHDGSLSVRLAGAPLREVLRAIAEQAEFRLWVRGDLGNARPQSFADLTLTRGIQRLVGDISMVMIFDPGTTATSRLAEVRVYGDRGGGEVEIWPIQATSPATGASSGGAEHAVEVLVETLEREPEPQARELAAINLIKMGGEDAAAALTAALHDENASVRVRAVRGVYLIRGDEAAADLAVVTVEDKDPEVRYTAVRLLARLDVLEAHWALRKATSDPDDNVREAAREAMVRWREGQ